jgi:hypothetical protein
MNAFVQRRGSAVMGMLSGWDRLRFRGTLRMLANVTGLSNFLSYTGHLLKDFGQYALQLSREVRAASLAVVEAAGRPVVHLNGPSLSKEDTARQIARRDSVTEGPIAVLTAIEPCWTYDIQSDRAKGHLQLIHSYRKCQHLYHYQVHPVFGFMHVRLQTWLPFNLHVCLNGREWLARQMDAAGIAYRRADNCFTHIDDLPAAQALAEAQVTPFDWAKALGELVPKVNPALPSIIGGYRIPYYWSLDESEWASDVMFRSAAALSALYPALLRHGIESFGSPEVMRFLGRPLTISGQVNPKFQGEVLSDYRRRPEGVRLKHRVNRNAVKMYDKAGSVLRVETTLNNMRDIRAPRVVKDKDEDGKTKTVYRPMRKGVADMPRRAQVSQACNRRYLEAMAAVDTPLPLKTLTDGLSQPVRWKRQSVRGLNLLGSEDAALLAAVGRGEFLISGFRNRDLQGLLLPTTSTTTRQLSTDPAEQRRRSGQVTRKIRMLRAHGLIHKVPHTHRYLVSDKGRRLITALHAAREADIDKLTKAA